MKKHIFFGMVLVVAGLTGCNANKPSQVSMRLGVTESLDAYPVNISYSAEAFTAQNIDLRITTFKTSREISNALERDDLDAGMLDLPSAVVLAASANPAQILRTAMQATPQRPMYVIIARRDTALTTLTQLEGKTLSVADGLGEQYAADQLLSVAKIDMASVKRKSISDASQGVDLLRKGDVDAVLVPELMTWGPLSRETRLLASPVMNQVGQVVFVASRKFITAQPDGLKRFMVAYEAGFRAILWDPEPYRSILTKTGVSKELAGQFAMPDYPLAQLPTESDIEEASTWLVKHNLMNSPMASKTAGNAAFLPDPSLVEQAIFCHRP